MRVSLPLRISEFSAYYGATGVGLRGHRHHQGWEFQVGRMLEAFLGKVSPLQHTWPRFVFLYMMVFVMDQCERE